MFAPVTHALAMATIRRERILPIPGRVLVRKGQNVSASDVVAETIVAPQHKLYDVARALGVSASQAVLYIQCSAGMQVASGDIIAGPVGMTKRVLRAPQDGRVLAVENGQILMQVESPAYGLKAGLTGTVSDILDDQGVIVEATGALIQGVWGNGKIDYGLLNVVASRPDDRLRSDHLDVSMRGTIIFSSYLDDPDVLKTAAGLPLRGLILGCISVELIPHALAASFPIVVIEGWGRRLLNVNAQRILTSAERREVALNAEGWDRRTGRRPEIVITLPTTGENLVPKDVTSFEPGEQVHLFRAPYAGNVGTIMKLLPGFTRLPSGISTRAAQIRLENGEDVVVPLANLEVMG